MASEDIVQLDYPEHPRKRPNMYIGTTDNCDVLLREICDNSIDELYADKPKDSQSKCDSMWVFTGESYEVADNCRGIPTKESPQKKGWTMTRLAVGSLNAGSKFDKNQIAVGQNGVGSSVVNALSEKFQIMSRMKLQDVSKLPKKLREECPEVTDDLYYYCYFEKGYLKDEGFKKVDPSRYGGEYPSTITSFKPDTSIMKSPRAKLPSSLPYVNYILKQLGRDTHIYVNGKEYKDSLTSYGVDFKVNIPLNPNEESELNKERGLTLMVTLGFQPKLDPCEIIGSVNGLDCPTGFHIRLFQNAFDKAFKEVFSDCKRYEFMGMRMAVILLATEVGFTSQTKEKLADVDGFKSSRDYELNYIGKELKKLFKKQEYYSQFKNHELKILEYMKSTEKLGRKEFIKSTVLIASQSSRSDAMVPEKLIDCSSTNRRECELYLCFTGDTEVLDCNNNRIRFDELSERIKSGEEVYTFSCDPEGYKSPSKIVECKESKRVDRLVKVTLDNGESFKSTLDHKIMMRDGTYKEAQDLKVGDSCMPIYIATYPTSDYGGSFRRVIQQPSKSRATDKKNVLIYRVMANHPDCEVRDTEGIIHIHHIDCNPLNDYPNNLVKIEENHHRALHGARKLHIMAHEDPEVYNRIYVDNKRTPEFRKNASENMKRLMQNPETRQNLRDKANEEWSDPKLREWRSLETKKYALNHPEEMKERAAKAHRNKRDSYAERLVDNLRSLGLELTYSNFDDQANDDPGYHKHYTFSYTDEYLQELGLVNDYEQRDREEFEVILDYLKSNDRPISRYSWNDALRDLDLRVLKPVTFSKFKQRYPDLIARAELELNRNHKVESVEFLNVGSEPVYCLTVDNELHNFPLACGIFVKNCEGNSAGGSLVKCRDPRIHAVLPLRGKVLNTAGLEIEQVLTNREMKDLISAIGVGVNDYHDMSEVRYGKIIIVADSDPDGLNIDALCLGALATHLTFLVEAGCVYVARSPLFKQGDKYYLDSSQLDKTKPYSRFKGLGECNPEDLAPFVFDKNTRELIKITMDNWEDARDMLTSASAKREVMYQHNVISEERVEYQR